MGFESPSRKEKKEFRDHDIESPEFHVRLGVDEDATVDKIWKAYEELTALYHPRSPDRSKGNLDGKNFDRLFEAYSKLTAVAKEREKIETGTLDTRIQEKYGKTDSEPRGGNFDIEV